MKERVKWQFYGGKVHKIQNEGEVIMYVESRLGEKMGREI